MTALAMLADYFTDPQIFASNAAVTASRTAGEHIAKVNYELRESATFDFRAELLDAIEVLMRDCSHANWDGYGAPPLSPWSVQHALSFLFTLPSFISSPEVAADPDGEVSLVWESGERVFSVSISADGALTFAGLFGGRANIYGTERFSGEIPTNILQGILRTYQGDRDQTAATLRFGTA